MKRCYHVDLPNPEAHRGRGIQDWIHIAVTRTKPQAQKLLRDVWGIKARQSGTFITEGQE